MRLQNYADGCGARGRVCFGGPVPRSSLRYSM